MVSAFIRHPCGPRQQVQSCALNGCNSIDRRWRVRVLEDVLKDAIHRQKQFPVTISRHKVFMGASTSTGPIYDEHNKPFSCKSESRLFGRMKAQTASQDPHDARLHHPPDPLDVGDSPIKHGTNCQV